MKLEANTALRIGLVCTVLTGVIYESNVVPRALKLILNHLDFDGELGASVEEIAQKYGYPIEVHEIQTKDGYILKTFRIPVRNSSTGMYRHGEPVLINHPFLSTALDYFMLSEHGALPFMYADAGFDVWLGNLRGSSYSRHVSLTENDPEYWQFTMHQSGTIDFPAQIDYILNVTGRKQLLYYGFSLATALPVVGIKERPDINEKIRRMTLVSPVGALGHSQHYLFADPFESKLQYLSSYWNGKLVTGNFLRPIISITCHFFPRLGKFWLKLLGEYNPGQVTERVLTKFMWNFPDQTSFATYQHACQGMRSTELPLLDYGSDEANLRFYGTKSPPVCNWSSVTIPTCGLMGKNDIVVKPKSSLAALSEMQNWCNQNSSGFIDDPHWTHLDNMYGKDAPRLVYERSIRFHLQNENECSC